ncbi:hypothetical protein BG015_009767 [Linnemannia schmuckeri]|uniref:DNA helicase n=1 Tax=Linnemannia schmuckeri TaxID=64567 RepID=A0A9P5V9C5_9FUNG|nr:hypothetical protein BG015_009767 [Linnemannia schmuckeri]
MSAMQRLQEFRFKKAQEAAAAGSKAPQAAASRSSSATSSSCSNSNSNSNSSSRSISKERVPTKSAPLIIPGSSDIELNSDSESDMDLRKGVNKLSTYSPARRTSPKPSSDRPMTSARRINSTLSSPQSSTFASQSTLPFKKLVGSFRYTGQDAEPSPSPSDLLSDQSLSSPGQSQSDNDEYNDIAMTGARNGHTNGSSASNGHSHPAKPIKRQIISSDEDDAIEVKPRRRLVKKGDMDRASTAPPNEQVPQRRRLVKRALLDSDSNSDSDSESGAVKTAKSIEILSDDDVEVASTLDETLARLQDKYPEADFDDLKSALDKADGEYALADGILASKFHRLFDLGASNGQHSAQRSSNSDRHSQQNRLDRLIHKPSSFKAVPLPVKSSPAPVRKQARSSESEEMSELSEDSYDEDGERNSYEGQHRKEERALAFFNEATKLELLELSGCSKAQANNVIALRPFDTFDNLCVTLRKQKVGEKIVTSYLTTTDAIRAVDTMLKTVDRVREDLVKTLNVWCGDESGKLFESGSNSNTVKVDNADKATDEEEDHEPGMELVDVDVDKASATEEGKEAMRYFIRKQPGNMAPGFQLKGYQLLGINWLALLWRKKLSGILADEMGLGKTAQVIAFLAHLFENGEDGPFLVIVPTSTLSNWLREFEKFCPDLDVRCYYGSQPEREELRYNFDQDSTYDVIVTTYNIATSHDDRKFLNRRNFKGIILDEGHMVKNCTSARYKQLMSIKSPFRLLLTGTPLQNNLQELLSLLIFIMPKFFAEHEEALRTMFKIKSGVKSEKSTLLSKERIVRARHLLAPFVLRRKKIHVLKDLPRKVEHVIYCDLGPIQRALYDQIMKSSVLQTVLDESSDGELGVTELDSMDGKVKAKAIPKKQSEALKKATASEVANVLMQMRKAADHPMLFREQYKDATLKEMARVITQEIEFCDSNIDYIEEDMSVMTDFELHRLCQQYKSVRKFALPGEPWMEAAKVKELQKLLPRLIHEEKSRILIFSQFTMVLDILEPIMKTMGYKFLRLDGQTKVDERQPMIDSFNDDESYKIFLLSTKAGGFGINLTGANVVIMYDLDHNPHNDKQAEDRAHRVGQTKEVEVYKLIVRDTVEEQIYQVANLKLKLDQHVSQDDAAGGASTDNEGSGSSSSIAGVLSLVKKSWKAAYNGTTITSTTSHI